MHTRVLHPSPGPETMTILETNSRCDNSLDWRTWKHSATTKHNYGPAPLLDSKQNKRPFEHLKLCRLGREEKIGPQYA